MSTVLHPAGAIAATRQRTQNIRKKSAGAIVYERSPDDRAPWPHIDIYTVEVDGTNDRALTSDGRSHSPSWSPDGWRIFFIRDAYDSEELYAMDRDGSNTHLVRKFGERICCPAWSPDGKTLAIGSMRDLFLLSGDALGEPKRLFRNAGLPHWSPDGKKIAFVSNPGPASWAVNVASADGSGEVQLTDPSVYPYASPSAWSPEGRQIAFSATDRHGTDQIFLTDENGATPRQLTSDSNWHCRHASWSPDGEQIVVSCNASVAPCAAGITGGSIPKPSCVRRILVLSTLDPESKLIQIIDHDGAGAVFAPRQ